MDKNYDGKRVYNGFWRKFDQNKNFPEIAGKQIRMYFDFDTQENEAIEVQFAISPVSQANAMENLEKETGSLSFEQVKAKAQEDWNKELNKIVIKGTEDQKSISIQPCITLLSIRLFIWMLIGNTKVLIRISIKQKVLLITLLSLYGTPTEHCIHISILFSLKKC